MLEPDSDQESVDRTVTMGTVTMGTMRKGEVSVRRRSRDGRRNTAREKRASLVSFQSDPAFLS